MHARIVQVAAPIRIVVTVAFVRTTRVFQAVVAVRTVQAVKFVRTINVSLNQGVEPTPTVARARFARTERVWLAVE